MTQHQLYSFDIQDVDLNIFVECTAVHVPIELEFFESLKIIFVNNFIHSFTENLTSNFETVKSIIILLITSSFENFSEERLSNEARQSVLRFTSALISSSSKTPSIQRFTLKIIFLKLNNFSVLHAYLSSFCFTSRSVSKSIRPFITFTGWTLIYVNSLKIHLNYRSCSIP